MKKNNNLADLVDQYMGVNPPSPHVYNCCESFIRACNDYYSLGLSEDSLMMFCSFGGGLNMGLDCGFYLGGIAVIGKLFHSDSPPYKNAKVIEATKAWYECYCQELGSNQCIDLKDAVNGCGSLGHRAADLFEKFIESEKDA